VSALIDAYDVALFDLDGVIYLGPDAVPGAAEALAELSRRAKQVMYVTNNAARPAQVVIDQLNRLGFAADTDNVLTSAQVAAAALQDELPRGAKILVCGSTNLAALLGEAGFQVVEGAADQPDAVIQGYDPDLNWHRFDEAALAIQGGARWFATNGDASRPTDRGLVPGVGGAIALLATALGGAPTIFGKPYPPMLDEAVRRTGASHPIFVGDRLDTDIVAAVAAGMDSLMVFSGAHGKGDLVAARPEAHPSCIGSDVGALLAPRRNGELAGSRATCRAQEALASNGQIVVTTSPKTFEEQLDALWAVAQLAWRDANLRAGSALDALELVP
jgi:HAD superfamily hydrolase (TIGR01450 family)